MPKMIIPDSAWGALPGVLDALFGLRLDGGPVSVTVTIGKDSEDRYAVWIAAVAGAASGTDLSDEVREYICGDGAMPSLLGAANRVMPVTIGREGGAGTVGPRRTNRAAEFGARLDQYESAERFPEGTIRAVNRELRRLGYPGTEEASRRPFLSDGRKEGTSAPMLVAAIRGVSNSSECAARFECLARQVWGWKYPRLGPEDRRLLQEDFGRVAAAQGRAHENCSNPTIRMLWHFHEVGIPFSVEMFKLPVGAESWSRNISSLGEEWPSWVPTSPARRRETL